MEKLGRRNSSLVSLLFALHESVHSVSVSSFAQSGVTIAVYEEASAFKYWILSVNFQAIDLTLCLFFVVLRHPLAKVFSFSLFFKFCDFHRFYTP